MDTSKRSFEENERPEGERRERQEEKLGWPANTGPNYISGDYRHYLISRRITTSFQPHNQTRGVSTHFLFFLLFFIRNNPRHLVGAFLRQLEPSDSTDESLALRTAWLTPPARKLHRQCQNPLPKTGDNAWATMTCELISRCSEDLIFLPWHL